jgi:InsA N-terminal domain
MVTHGYLCPHCQEAEPVVRFGTNRSGTQRLWCEACRKSFTPGPRDRSVTPEKEERIASGVVKLTFFKAMTRHAGGQPFGVTLMLQEPSR